MDHSTVVANVRLEFEALHRQREVTLDRERIAIIFRSRILLVSALLVLVLSLVGTVSVASDREQAKPALPANKPRSVLQEEKKPTFRYKPFSPGA